jgi:hypothetical protein
MIKLFINISGDIQVLTDDSLFQKQSGTPLYQEIRLRSKTDPCYRFVKKHWSKLYKNHHNQLDKNFANIFPSEPVSRLWELIMVNYLDSTPQVNLLDIPGKKKKSCPDFCFSLLDKKFYVECTTATTGDPKNYRDLNSNPKDNETRDVPTNEFKKRLASAIKEKALTKYKNKENKKGYEEIIYNDGFIIAIFIDIPVYHQPSTFEAILSCFFPFSDNEIMLPPQKITNKNTSEKFHYKHQVTFPKKSNSNPIDNSYFSDHKYSHVSAALIADRPEIFYPNTKTSSMLEKHTEIKNDFILIHNPFAKRPLPHHIFPVRWEYAVKDVTSNKVTIADIANAVIS